MSETKGDYYPRKAALLQEDEISKLQVQVNLLRTENAALKEKLTQYEQGRPMYEAPKTGSLILCEIEDKFGSFFDFLEWDDDQKIWVGYLSDYQDLYMPNKVQDEYLSRWWPLPGGNKNG